VEVLAQRSLVQRSFVAAATSPDELASRFYDELFALAPETRGLVTDDRTLQRQQLFDELTGVVAAMATTAEPAAAVRAGAHHDERVRRAMLAALAATLGDRWTDATAAAWVESYQRTAMGSGGAAPESAQTSGQG
jgi:nitric oxide dioxygenase